MSPPTQSSLRRILASRRTTLDDPSPPGNIPQLIFNSRLLPTVRLKDVCFYSSGDKSFSLGEYIIIVWEIGRWSVIQNDLYLWAGIMAWLLQGLNCCSGEVSWEGGGRVLLLSLRKMCCALRYSLRQETSSNLYKLNKCKERQVTCCRAELSMCACMHALGRLSGGSCIHTEHCLFLANWNLLPVSTQ